MNKRIGHSLLSACMLLAMLQLYSCSGAGNDNEISLQAASRISPAPEQSGIL